MTGSRSLNIAYDSPLHRRLQRKISSRITFAERGGTAERGGASDRASTATRFDRWRKAEEMTLAYLPESEADQVRRGRRENDGTPVYTTIQIPYTYAVLMSAHTYWTSVFFARSPIHQYTGRHGEAEMQIQALEALINYQTEVGNALGPYYIWLYDTGKYGLGVLGHYWDVEKIHYGQIVEIPDATGKPVLYQATQEVEGYRGNKCYNLSPYDFFPDPRVPVGRFQDGEFVCVRKRMGWHQVLRRKDAGYFINTHLLREHRGTDKGQTDGSSQLARPGFVTANFDDTDEVGAKVDHPAGIVFWEVYVDLVPNEWGLGSSNYPEKWCFSITEDKELIIGASPLGYIHGQFPFDVMEMEVEGYGTFNRGVPDIIHSVQNTMDWLLNTHFFNVRAALNNQFIIDPSKIVIKDATKAGPGFTWRLRPEAYGTDISKMFMQIPVNDVTRGHVADLPVVKQLGELALGVNDQVMGALSAGTNRKTATEVRTSTGFGVNRMKTITEYMSATAFSPHSQKLVQTSQQLYDVQSKLRIAGSLALDAGANFVNVTPDTIAGFFDFVPVDGTLPVDRMAQANLWKEIFASLGRMPPQIQTGWDWAKMFGWMASIAGLKNINQFKIQVMQPGQAPGGNVIPLRPPMPPGAAVTPGNAAATQNGLNALDSDTDGM